MTATPLQSKLLAAGAVAAVSTTLAACGGTSPAAGSNAAVNAQKPSAEYVVHVTGTAETPPGPRSGVGYAIIALHDPAHEVCWRFAHLHGFVNATTAEIAKGAPRTNGTLEVALGSGPALHHRGCVPVSAKLMGSIAADPRAYYVNVHSVAYPRGAVRAQL